MTSDAVRRIKGSLPLPVLVGEYLQMRKGGPQWLVLCPWHKESNPSCRVYDDHLHCFTCGAHADAIDFISQVERVSKMDAIRRLSDRTGIPLDDRRQTRTQVAYDKDAQAFTDWWWRITGERLARRLTAYVRMATEAQADAAGLDWRIHNAFTGQARRHACLRMATAQERTKWKFRMAWDKETTEMMVGILEAAA